jgi:hypothetical protein
MRRILLALIATLVGFAVMPATADATPRPDEPSRSLQICEPHWFVSSVGPPFRGWICRPIPVLPRELPPDWPIPPECRCLYAIDLRVHDVLPASHANEIMSRVHLGLNYLGQAAVTSNPGQAAQLRNSAMSAFTLTAQILGGLRLPAARGGILDPSGTTFLPSPTPNPQQAADHLRSGITMLQQWIGNQDPELWDLIVPQFDSAYTLLAQH